MTTLVLSSGAPAVAMVLQTMCAVAVRPSGDRTIIERLAGRASVEYLPGI